MLRRGKLNLSLNEDCFCWRKTSFLRNFQSLNMRKWSLQLNYYLWLARNRIFKSYLTTTILFNYFVANFQQLVNCCLLDWFSVQRRWLKFAQTKIKKNFASRQTWTEINDLRFFFFIWLVRWEKFTPQKLLHFKMLKLYYNSFLVLLLTEWI